MLLAASTQRSIGLVILAIVFIGGLVYLFFNIRAAKPEIGSEVELAANRRRDVTDEDLEGRKLDLALGANLVMLTIIGVALPVYWLGEPGREAGRDDDTARIFANRGEELYVEGAQCISCHGADGTGASVSTSITTESGEFVAQVSWKAPALNTVLSRFSEDELLHTLNFGRNGVMPAWGAGGGGPLTDQQLEEIVFYLRTIQIDEETIRSEAEAGVMQGVRDFLMAGNDDYAVAVRDASDAVDEAEAAVEAATESNTDFDCTLEEFSADEQCAGLEAARDALSEANAEATDAVRPAAEAWLAEAQGVADTAREMALAEDGSLDDEDLRWAALELLSTPGAVPNQEQYLKYGELLFSNPAASGSYGCARCHTYGWSFDATGPYTLEVNGTETPIVETYEHGGGFFGKNLTGGSLFDQFETTRAQALFVQNGQTIGDTYGRGGSGGNGQMPGFGPRVEADTIGPGIDGDLETPYPALLTEAQIDAIVAFERNL